MLTKIYSEICRTGEWSTPWIKSLTTTLPKKGNLQLSQNYRTINLISHASKVMMKVILNRLTPQAEEIIAEEQTGFLRGSTTEQIFNISVLCDKYTSKISTMSLFSLRMRPTGCMGHDEQIQHGLEDDRHHQTAVRKSQQCSTYARHSGRLVSHISRGPSGLPPLTHPVQDLP